jgi:hypothetical protein
MTWISNLAQLKYYEELIGDAFLTIFLLAFFAYLAFEEIKEKLRERKLRKEREKKHHQN